MTKFDDAALTQAVLDRFADTPDPRLKAVLTALTRHLHAFVRDVNPTFEEWMQGVEFLTRTGQICSDTRQEYILFSDVMGVSMLVDALNHAHQQAATETTVLGPFYVHNPRPYPQGADISGGMDGQPLYVDVTVGEPAGEPLAGATVDVWQSDDEGFYDVQHTDKGGADFLRGRFTTDDAGRLRFWSNLPVPYPIPHDGPVGELLQAARRHPWRPAHLHFMISAPGHETLVTHLFVAGGDYLDSDAVFGVKPSLVVDFPEHPPGQAPDGRRLDRPWRSLNHAFVLSPQHGRRR